MRHDSRSRREFLRRSAALLAAGGIATLAPQLRLIGQAAAAGKATGYRALVCVYLNGGNDSWNLLLPADAARHGRYTATRNGLYNATANTAGLAIPRPGDPGFIAGQTLPRALAIGDGSHAVNPFAAELAQLHGENRLAFLANIGPLIEPLTVAELGSRRVPPQLFSHSDQTSLWQLGNASSTQGGEGWGGRIAARVAMPAAALSPALSIAGQTRFLVGRRSDGGPLLPFALTTDLASPAPTLLDYDAASIAPNQFHAARRQRLEALLAGGTHAFGREYAATLQRAVDLGEGLLNPALAAIPADDPVNGDGSFAWPASSLGDQLRQVARMIRISRSQTGYTSPIEADRQVYFVQIGGFDSHDSQILSPTAATGQHGLLQELSQAAFAFQRAMAAIGSDNDVTLFTMSEFARTLNSNGSGTDHAWGGVQLAVGGAVNGGAVFGRYPELQLDNRAGGTGSVSPELGESLARGQLLPTLAVDQLGATMAQWMGVPADELSTLFPNLDNFVDGPFANTTATPAFSHFSPVIPGLMAGVA